MKQVLDDKNIQLIRKACKGKKHLKLTIGYVREGFTGINVINEHGDIDSDRGYRYEIGSITKTFTASLLSKYVAMHKLSLQDVIPQYIQGLKENIDHPNLLRLATHTSGYAASLPFSKREYFKMILGLITGGGDMKQHNPFQVDEAKMRALIKRYPLKDKDYPWKYANFGFALLGYALGTISGRGYWETMNDFIEQELRLTQTWLGNEKTNLSGYDNKDKACEHWKWHPDEIMSPAGALSSTASDLLDYANLIINNTHPYLTTCTLKHAVGNKRYDMGLGWWLLKKNTNIFWHGGGTGCFSSFLGCNREKKTAVVVLANYRMGFDAEQKIGFSLLERISP